MKHILYGSIVAAGLATTAAASPITVEMFPGTDLTSSGSDFYNSYTSLVGSKFITEDFEDRGALSGTFENGDDIASGPTTEGEIETSVGTVIGSFTTVANPGTGTGSTCGGLDLIGDDCDNIAYQNPEILNGQGNTIPFGGSGSLNTADTKGMVWSVDTGSLFDELVFVLRDAADINATLTISDGTNTWSDSGLANENLLLVRVKFGSQISSATVTMASSTNNDAFSYDGGAVNVVPLPAAGWMLLAGIGAIGAVSRRKRKATA